jgi:hypothetical protein
MVRGKKSPFFTSFTRSGKDIQRTVKYKLKIISSIPNTQLQSIWSKNLQTEQTISYLHLMKNLVP